MRENRNMPITCNKCSAHFNTPLYEFINADSNPNIQEMLLDQQIFQFSCPNCGAMGIINYPVLYYDNSKKFTVTYVPLTTQESLSQYINDTRKRFPRTYKHRIVYATDEMVEKIEIFNANLDDRVIEILRLFVIGNFSANNKQRADDAMFYAQDGTYRFMVFANKTSVGNISFSYPIYLEIMSHFQNELQEDNNPIIDATWCANFLNQFPEFQQ